jgi:hypothetical protein
LQEDWGNFDLIAGFRYLGVNATTNFNLALSLTGPRGNGAGYQTGWAGVSLTYRYLSFQQSSSGVVQHLWIRGPMIIANFTF